MARAGFFAADTTKKKPKKEKVYDCNTCGLYRTCITPKMPAYGEGREKILIIGECPSKNEDAKGEPLSGAAGNTLEKELAALGIDVEEDCLKINAINCFPGKGKEASHAQIKACRSRVRQVIAEFKPKMILALGSNAMESLYGDTVKKTSEFGISKWRGFRIPDRRFNAWVCPTFHPSYIVRMKDDKKMGVAVSKVWRDDLRAAITRSDAPLPHFENEFDLVDVLTDIGAIRAFLKDMLRNPPDCMAFDYETPCLKPHRGNVMPRCVSVCFDENKATVFPLFPEILPLWKAVLLADDIMKTAHHMKFEQMWSDVALNAPPQSWDWCSMIAAHVLDNRQGITGLKFQATVNYGLVGYNSEVEDYLEPDEEDEAREGANALNKIDMAPFHKILEYCGVDSLVQYRLMLDQKAIIEKSHDFTRAYDLLHLGSLALSKAEAYGICVDMKHLEVQLKHYARKIEMVRSDLMEMPELIAWKKKMGEKFNMDSNQQLAKVIYDDMGIECVKFTDKGGRSTDEAAMSAIDHPMVRKIMELRKLQKVHGTFLSGIYREVIDGVLHPFFHLHTVKTFRSSSSNPNFQNLPIRDPVMGKVIRKCFIPRPGRMLLEVDYSGVEVRMGQPYHNDPQMLKYIHDKSTDMHRDMAIQIFMLDDDDWTKPIRQTTKGKWVFAQFYGDWYKTCAESLWNDIDLFDLKTASGVPLKEHLRKKGIRDLEDFTEHCKEVEDHFWNVRFKTYGQWRKDWYAAYQKKGFFKTLTGFVCKGVMSRNDATNYPIQGVAFHCLLWSFIKVTEFLEQGNFRSRLVGQIHDSMIIDLEPSELNEVMEAVTRIMTKDLLEEWQWINVPLEVEADLTPVNTSWYDKRAISEHSCKECDSKWAWTPKTEDKTIIIYECPICGTRVTERKK